MQLLRYATIDLTRPAPERVGRWDFRATNGVQVHVLGIDGAIDATDLGPVALTDLTVAWPYETDHARLAVCATAEAGPPMVDIVKQLVELPDEPRQRAEAAILQYADMLSVSYQCRRVVRSPRLCVCLTSDDDTEWEILANTKGIHGPYASHPRALFLPDLRPGSPLGELVKDRTDGVALLADALSADGPVGQVQSMLRLFERAFALRPSKCVKPLSEFLQSGPPGLEWAHSEVKYWLTQLRGEIAHADRRETVARSSDVGPFVSRIEYAAYDILLNKTTWRNEDTGRRNSVELPAGPASDHRTLVLHRPDTKVVLQWTDPFGVFLTDFNAKIGVGERMLATMPGYADETGAYTASVRIREDYKPTRDHSHLQVLTYHQKRTPTKDLRRPDRNDGP